jgi:predicted ribosomally synthesized peptide with nif11-like leader
MAVETAIKFLELFAGDEALQNQLRITDPADTDDLVRFASSKGFIFSAQDLRAALKESSEDGAIEALREKLA